MLKYAYLLAKIGADTAENERHFAKHLPKKLATTLTLRSDAEARRRRLLRIRALRIPALRRCL